MGSKFIISLFYALAFTVWPPHNAETQTRYVPTTVSVDEFDSAVFYELQAAKKEFRYLAGSTKSIQREAMKNLQKLESKRKLLRVDTVYILVYAKDSTIRENMDTVVHKRNFLQKLFNK